MKIQLLKAVTKINTEITVGESKLATVLIYHSFALLLVRNVVLWNTFTVVFFSFSYVHYGFLVV